MRNFVPLSYRKDYTGAAAPGLMGTREDAPVFEQYWMPHLFPELVSKGTQPHGWTEKNDIFVMADSVNWNQSYTQRVFPEELWEFRNSGALLRDWEEAAAWIYLEYAWDSIIASLNETEFEKIK
jgi:hypothetical protein